MQRLSISAVLGVVLIVACAPKDGTATRADSTAAVATSPATPDIPVVTVHAKDYAFDAPDTIRAGMTTFHLINDGPGLHHLQILRLDSAKTVADLKQALAAKAPPPHWMVEVGGPNAPDPKSEANATLSLPAGNYVMICFVDVPGGVPHFTKGMLKPLTVVAAPAGEAQAVAPTPNATMTLSDYTFTVSHPLAAGKQVVEVQNNGTQPHEVEIIRLNQGKTEQDMLGWMNDMKGPPPGSAVGGVAALIPGSPVYFTSDLTPGQYVLICFLPDAKDGKPHFMKGMVQTITVS